MVGRAGTLCNERRTVILSTEAERGIALADRVLPIVRLLFACDSVARDELEEKWILKNPWAVVTLPEGASFPFDAEEIWLYAQLAEGIGDFQLAVEVRQVRDNGTERKVGRSEAGQIEFIGGNQLAVIDTVFQLTQVPFDEPGLYQFHVMANYAQLKGQIAEIRVLDRRDRV